MAYKIIVSPIAIQNIDQAVGYYKQNASAKVALNFINEYKKTFEQILDVKYFQIYFDNFRAKPMAKFPFIIFYTLNENTQTIIIKAVFHTSQNPTNYPKQ